MEGAILVANLLTHIARGSQQQAILHHRGGVNRISIRSHRIESDGAHQRDQNPRK